MPMDHVQMAAIFLCQAKDRKLNIGIMTHCCLPGCQSKTSKIFTLPLFNSLAAKMIIYS